MSNSLLLDATSAASAKKFKGLRLVYHATFGNGSLDSGVDPLDIGPLVPSHSDNGGIASWTPMNGNIELGITWPTGLIAPRVRANVNARKRACRR